MNVEVKIPPGTKCHYLGNIPGVVTAVTIREGYQVHEFSYIDHEGNPKTCIATKWELKVCGGDKMGFGSKDGQVGDFKQ